MNARARLNRAQLRQFKFNGNAKESVDAQDASARVDENNPLTPASASAAFCRKCYPLQQQLLQEFYDQRSAFVEKTKRLLAAEVEADEAEKEVLRAKNAASQKQIDGLLKQREREVRIHEKREHDAAARKKVLDGREEGLERRQGLLEHRAEELTAQKNCLDERERKVQQREDEVTKVLLEDAAALAGSDVEAAADSRSKQGNALGASASESVHELYVNFRNKQLQQASVIHDDVDGTTGRNANPHQFLISALKSVAAEKQAADNRAGELEGRVLSLERAHKDEIRELRSLLDHERRAAASASEASASKLVAESEMKLQEQAERLGCEHGKAVEKLEREKEELAEEVARWRDVEYAKLQDELGRFEAEVLPRLFTKEDVEERIEHAVKQEQHRCEELAKEKLQQVKGTWKAKKEKTEAKLLEDIAELKSELQESKVHAEATEQLALAGKTTITDIEGENLELKAKIGKMAAAEFAWQTEKDGWGKDKQVLERKCEILETEKLRTWKDGSE
eukprot:g9069.t1